MRTIEKKVSNIEEFSPGRLLSENFDLCVPIGPSEFCEKICLSAVGEKVICLESNTLNTVEEIGLVLRNESAKSREFSDLINSGNRVLFVRMPEPNSIDEKKVGTVSGDISELAKLIESDFPNLSFKIFIIRTAESIEDMGGELLMDTSAHPRIERIYPNREDLEEKSRYFLTGLLRKKEKIDAEFVRLSEHHFFNDKISKRRSKTIYELDIMGNRFHFMTNLSKFTEGGPMIVIFGAAANLKTTDLPLFSWWRIADSIGAPYVMIEDPMQENFGLDCGWYLGSRNFDYFDYIERILRHIMLEIGCPEENILLFGGSSGGFGALMMSGRIRGSSVFIDNPQTSVTKYHHRKVVDESIEILKGGGELSKELQGRTDVMLYFENIGYFPPYVKYCQNNFDPEHINTHMNPFKEWVEGSKWVAEGKSKIVFKNYERARYDGKKGHLRMSDENLVEEAREILVDMMGV